MSSYDEVNINNEKTVGNSVSDKNFKLSKNGIVKNTPNNSYLNQIKKGYPLCDIKDIEKMTNYFREQITMDNRELGYRNLLMFILGINSGLKMSQLLTLKWDNMVYINEEYHVITIKKQIETKYILNSKCKIIINEYKSEIKPSLNDNDYIFITRQSKHLSIDSTAIILKEAAKTINIKQNINNNSLYNTYLYYEILENKNNLHYHQKLSSIVGHRAFIQALENFKYPSC